MIISIGLGAWGIDRFYIGDVSLGVGKATLTALLMVVVYIASFNDDLLTGFMIAVMLVVEVFVLAWYITDIFKVQNRIKASNYNNLLLLLD